MSFTNNAADRTLEAYALSALTTQLDRMNQLLPPGIAQSIKRYVIPYTSGILGGSVLHFTDPRGLTVAFIAKKCFSEAFSQIEGTVLKDKIDELFQHSDKEKAQIALSVAKFATSCLVGKVVSQFIGYDVPITSIIGCQIIAAATSGVLALIQEGKNESLKVEHQKKELPKVKDRSPQLPRVRKKSLDVEEEIKEPLVVPAVKEESLGKRSPISQQSERSLEETEEVELNY